MLLKKELKKDNTNNEIKLKNKNEQIQLLFQQLENACSVIQGIECWSARELQEILYYTK